MCLKPKYALISNNNEIVKGKLHTKKIKIITKKQYYKLRIEEKEAIGMTTLPCGQCEECRALNAQQWATRAYNETKTNNKGIFVTLTYKDEKLPRTKKGYRTLKIEDTQKFKKKLRQKIYRDTKIREQIKTLECGEYGDKKGRPHYHMLIWNYKPKDLKTFKKSKSGEWLYKSKELTELWGLGKVIIGNITYESSAYVARYTTKKLTKRKLEDEQKKPYINMSRGKGNAIGLQYYLQNKDKIWENKGIYVKTKKGISIKQIPRYYKKIKDKEDEKQYNEKIEKLDLNIKDERKRINDKWLRIKKIWKKVNKKITPRTKIAQEEIEWRKLYNKNKEIITELLKINNEKINNENKKTTYKYKKEIRYKLIENKINTMEKNNMKEQEYDEKQIEMKREKYKILKRIKSQLDI